MKLQAAAECWGSKVLGDPLLVGCFSGSVGAPAFVPASLQGFLERPDTWSRCPCS